MNTWWNKKAEIQVSEDKKEEGEESEENEVSFENGVTHRATKVQFAELAGTPKWLMISFKYFWMLLENSNDSGFSDSKSKELLTY